MIFKENYTQTKEFIEEHLYLYIEKIKDTPQNTVFEAMEYSLKAGGKRIRPLLFIETLNIFGINPKEAIPFFCALEYIHTYSLIHDDLPAMDNDELRRGLPTNHKVFGEAMAILAGDGLLNTAFEILFEDLEKNNSIERIQAATLICKCAGTQGMIAGQIVDMESENKEISLEQLKYLHSKKTGALLKASILSAALIGKASPDEYKALEIYADNIGLAFQIADDILDVTGNTQVLGKQVGSDETQQKSTYVTIFGIEKSQALAIECISKGKSALSIFDESKRKFLEDLANFIISRKN